MHYYVDYDADADVYDDHDVTLLAMMTPMQTLLRIMRMLLICEDGVDVDVDAYDAEVYDDVDAGDVLMTLISASCQ